MFQQVDFCTVLVVYKFHTRKFTVYKAFIAYAMGNVEAKYLVTKSYKCILFTNTSSAIQCIAFLLARSKWLT